MKKERNRVIKKKVKTHEQVVADRHAYYISHAKIYQERAKKFAINNPDKVKTYLDRFTKKHPTYRRDVTRVRVAAVEPLIFQFLDGGFDRDIGDYVSYLQVEGVPDQHIRWFQVDIQPFLGDIQSNPSPQFSEVYPI